jgi:hypothetical protein
MKNERVGAARIPGVVPCKPASVQGVNLSMLDIRHTSLYSQYSILEKK